MVSMGLFQLVLDFFIGVSGYGVFNGVTMVTYIIYIIIYIFIHIHMSSRSDSYKQLDMIFWLLRRNEVIILLEICRPIEKFFAIPDDPPSRLW